MQCRGLLFNRHYVTIDSHKNNLTTDKQEFVENLTRLTLIAVLISFSQLALAKLKYFPHPNENAPYSLATQVDNIVYLSGQIPLDENGEMKRVKLTLSTGGNLAFDITPAKYVTAYVTEQGLLSAADLIERAG